MINAGILLAPATFGVSLGVAVLGGVLIAYSNGLFEEEWTAINVGSTFVSIALSAIPGSVIATKLLRFPTSNFPVATGVGSTFANGFVKYLKHNLLFGSNLVIAGTTDLFNKLYDYI